LECYIVKIFPPLLTFWIDRVGGLGLGRSAMVAILGVLIRSVAGPAARFAGVLATFVG
jgi:hypothetical protein